MASKIVGPDPMMADANGRQLVYGDKVRLLGTYIDNDLIIAAGSVGTVYKIPDERSDFYGSPYVLFSHAPRYVHLPRQVIEVALGLPYYCVGKIAGGVTCEMRLDDRRRCARAKEHVED